MAVVDTRSRRLDRRGLPTWGATHATFGAPSSSSANIPHRS